MERSDPSFLDAARADRYNEFVGKALDLIAPVHANVEGTTERLVRLSTAQVFATLATAEAIRRRPLNDGS